MQGRGALWKLPGPPGKVPLPGQVGRGHRCGGFWHHCVAGMHLHWAESLSVHPTVCQALEGALGPAGSKADGHSELTAQAFCCGFGNLTKARSGREQGMWPTRQTAVGAGGTSVCATSWQAWPGDRPLQLCMGSPSACLRGICSPPPAGSGVSRGPGAVLGGLDVQRPAWALGVPVGYPGHLISASPLTSPRHRLVLLGGLILLTLHG